MDLAQQLVRLQRTWSEPNPTCIQGTELNITLISVDEKNENFFAAICVGVSLGIDVNKQILCKSILLQ